MVLLMKVSFMTWRIKLSLLNVAKLSAFCWNVHDGQLPEKDLSPTQKERALKKVPPILDYTAYVVRQIWILSPII